MMRHMSVYLLKVRAEVENYQNTPVALILFFLFPNHTTLSQTQTGATQLPLNSGISSRGLECMLSKEIVLNYGLGSIRNQLA
jgi:hypothetical protein